MFSSNERVNLKEDTHFEIQVLQVEDNPGDARLMFELLFREQVTDIKLSQTESLQGACKLIGEDYFDVILLDLSLPDAQGLEGLLAILKMAPNIAVVIISSSDDELTALKALQSGAQDYIVKGRFDSYALNKSIRYAVERKKIEERLSYLALNDPLTGLLNRASFMARVTESIDRSKRNGEKLAVFFIDMDQFKQVNDSFGHSAGDELLIQVAARFRDCLRAQDILARLSGDEFAILIEQLDEPENSDKVTQKLLAVMGQPFYLSKQQVYSTISIGVTVFLGNEASSEEALKQADMAMYKAKKNNGSSCEYFDQALGESLQVRRILEVSVQRAICNGEMELEYQPQVDVDNKLIGVEALLRWRHPAVGLVFPNLFIPLLEDTGNIIECGKWVLKEACQTIQGLIDRGAVSAQLQLSVNISAKQIKWPDFYNTVNEVLVKTGFPADQLVLEITETTLMQGSECNIKTFNQLRELGVTFSIDNFGTGFSSLSYLAKLPFSCMKIDRSFVQDIGNDKQNSTLVGAIIGLSENLNKDVIAEGVETRGQFDYLVVSGCTKFQGFLFSKSLDPNSLIRFAAKR
ncbi:MAG: EAL domain-containing protein [Pseudomonadales bacterium]|nr:EAL domain-containing protein [Pseudomonadales bacterium]NRA16735.1 EAL domain-containing protein [Oceanospirillaceae bacterium]